MGVINEGELDTSEPDGWGKPGASIFTAVCVSYGVKSGYVDIDSCTWQFHGGRYAKLYDLIRAADVFLNMYPEHEVQIMIPYMFFNQSRGKATIGTAGYSLNEARQLFIETGNPDSVARLRARHIERVNAPPPQYSRGGIIPGVDMRTSPVTVPEGGLGLMQIVPGTFAGVRAASEPSRERMIEWSINVRQAAREATLQMQKAFNEFHKPIRDCLEESEYIPKGSTVFLPDKPIPVPARNHGPQKRESHGTRIKRDQRNVPNSHSRRATGTHRLGSIHSHSRRG